MQRIFGAYAYGPGPRDGCWWDETCHISDRPLLRETVKADVAIVGAGFTGLNAALTLAQNGVSVVVVDQQRIGWGASGRNGGFCCLGGSKAYDAEIDAKFGKAARLEFRASEKAAVAYVEDLLEQYDIDVDRHSDGETELAHHARAMKGLEQSAKSAEENYGVTGQVIDKKDLAHHGMASDAFHGAIILPIGFGLNPRKYICGLADVAEKNDVAIYEKSPVRSVSQAGGKWVLNCDGPEVHADQILFATNGYSSENIPEWLRHRYLPTQSTVLVTREMSQIELSAQGWTTDQMSFDTRGLVHYFRLMPNNRFLFGMRGGVLSGPAAERRARQNNRRHFEKLFPAWSKVETAHSWSGFVSLSRTKFPYVGPVPKHEGVWTSMCYHGNGVAMGSYAGKLVADMMLSKDDGKCPELMQQKLRPFPLKGARRLLIAPLYASLMVSDL